MNETERIRKMVEAGTITDAEAERLLSVLRDIDRAGAELDASGADMEAEARRAEEIVDGAARPDHATGGAGGAGGSAAPAAQDAGGDAPGAETDAASTASTAPTEPTAPVAPAAPKAPAATPGSLGEAAAAASAVAAEAAAAAGASGAGSAAAGPAPVAATASAPAGTRWVRVSLLAGDLSLRADPEVDGVEVRGDADGIEVERTAEGFEVRHVKRDGSDSWIERFVSRIRSGQVELRIPAGYGVDLSVTAGDVDLHGIPYLRGRLTSGDLDARGLRGIDFSTAAGDLDLEMTPTAGRHSLRATAGDVNVRLGPGSSVEVDGSVSIGSASVRAPGFNVDRRGVGQHLRGRVGGGAAQLEVHVTTGDLNVKASDER